MSRLKHARGFTGRFLGPLMGGPQCRLSILRKVNVPCRYLKNFPVDFKKVPCPLSILRKVNVPCHYFLFLSVDFKRVLCRLSNLREGGVALSNLRVKGHILRQKGSGCMHDAHFAQVIQNMASLFFLTAKNKPAGRADFPP